MGTSGSGPWSGTAIGRLLTLTPRAVSVAHVGAPVTAGALCGLPIENQWSPPNRSMMNPPEPFGTMVTLRATSTPGEVTTPNSAGAGRSVPIENQCSPPDASSTNPPELFGRSATPRALSVDHSGTPNNVGTVRTVPIPN